MLGKCFRTGVQFFCRIVKATLEVCNAVLILAGARQRIRHRSSTGRNKNDNFGQVLAPLLLSLLLLLLLSGQQMTSHRDHKWLRIAAAAAAAAAPPPPPPPHSAVLPTLQTKFSESKTATHWKQKCLTWMAVAAS